LKFRADLDKDAQNFFTEIAEEMMRRFEISEEDAVQRINNYWPDKKFHGEDLIANILYHESPDYWSQAIYHGRPDFWRDFQKAMDGVIAEVKKATNKVAVLTDVLEDLALRFPNETRQALDGLDLPMPASRRVSLEDFNKNHAEYINSGESFIVIDGDGKKRFGMC